MKSKITFIILFSVSQISFGQVDSKEIFGQILAESVPVEKISIVNNNTQYIAISDSNGMFSIMVREGDVLVFSSVNLEPLKRRITAEDLVSNSLLIKMKTKGIELKEVVVNENAHITAENLGIIPKGQKKYTPAERKLATAGDFKPVMLLGLLGGSMPLDPLINKINGRTKRLKINVEIEDKQTCLQQLGYFFNDSYFVDYLKIPLEYIADFKFYVVENDYARQLLKSKNKPKLSSLLNELSLRYNEIIELEK
nr:carboxypeptidase-like regulatory domain-containing protein [uncultured Flavobacterium sp.]